MEASKEGDASKINIIDMANLQSEVEGLREKNDELQSRIIDERSMLLETVKRKQAELDQQIFELKAENRAQDQVIIKMQLDSERMEKENSETIQELTKTKRLVGST